MQFQSGKELNDHKWNPTIYLLYEKKDLQYSAWSIYRTDKHKNHETFIKQEK